MQSVVIKIEGTQVGWIGRDTSDQAMREAIRITDPFSNEVTGGAIREIMLRYLDEKKKHAQPGR